MKITSKELQEWVEQNRTIRYRQQLYKLRHSGLTADGKPNGYNLRTKSYFLMPADFFGKPRVGESIKVYHKGRGVYGLVTNKH